MHLKAIQNIPEGYRPCTAALQTHAVHIAVAEGCQSVDFRSCELLLTFDTNQGPLGHRLSWHALHARVPGLQILCCDCEGLQQLITHHCRLAWLHCEKQCTASAGWICWQSCKCICRTHRSSKRIACLFWGIRSSMMLLCGYARTIWSTRDQQDSSKWYPQFHASVPAGHTLC